MIRPAVPKAKHPGEAIADRPLLVMIIACRSLERTKNRNTFYLARANLARAVTHFDTNPTRRIQTEQS
jgi:hypothetical protein